jgi:Flp pilus assembly pilin Flp
LVISYGRRRGPEAFRIPQLRLVWHIWHPLHLGLIAAQSGQNVVEYGLIIATIAVVVLLGTLAFGEQVRPWFETLAGRITTYT